MARFNSGGSSGGGAPATVLVFQRLDVHVAAAPESTYTFTPASPLTWDDWTKIIVLFSGETTATLQLQARINGLTSANYFSNGVRMFAGAITAITQTSIGFWEILSATLISAFRQVRSTWEIQLTDPLIANEGYVGSINAGQILGGEIRSIFQNVNDVGPIDSLTTLTSTSTWKTGTVISTYGIRRID